jgi:two-component system phosphate regulon response regulator PhoB
MIVNASKPILVADDEIDVLDLVAKHLSQAGYTVLQAVDGGEALKTIRRYKPSLVILDIAMPSMNGFDICRALRSDPSTMGMPIMMLTARTSEIDRVLSFELGVDDFVSKPFSPRELVLRVHAILRRKTGAPAVDAVLSAGPISIERESLRTFVRGRPVALTTIEFKLLILLLENKSRTLQRSAILHAIWGYDSDVSLRTIDTHLRRLRRKLGREADLIHTVRGFGYRLDEGD